MTTSGRRRRTRARNRPRWNGRSRPRWHAPALAVVLAAELIAGLLWVPAAAPQLLGHNVGTPTSTSITATVPLLDARATLPTRAAEVAALLDRRATAIRVGDRAAFAATIDPTAGDFLRAQTQLFDNLAGVPLSEWSYQLDPTRVSPAPAGAGEWIPQVSLRYAIEGVDERPTTRPAVLTFVQRGSEWYVGADDDLASSGKPSWRGLWDFGPVIVARGRSSVVLAHPERAEGIDELTRIVDASVPVVTSVWGPQWNQTVGLLVPGDQQEMADLLGADLALDEIAAVAISDHADVERGIVLGQRVVVHPDNLDRLGPLGQRVVIQHEIAHIAARSITAEDTAMWLVEGFADYVGYLDSGVAVRDAARELTAEVAQGTIPQALPTVESFRGDNPRLGQAYQQAWLACLLIVERVGQDGLVRLYRGAAVGGQPALEAALSDVLGTTYEQFVVDWQAYVATVLA